MSENSKSLPENLKERIKESYDAIAPRYNKWTLPHSQNRMKYLEQLLEQLGVNNPKPASAGEKAFSFLELGCGAGIPVGARLLEIPNLHLVANDMSSTQIAIARQNLLGGHEDANKENAARVQFVEGDMTKLTFPDDKFDAVLGLYSIIHLPRDEQTALIGKIKRWLKPGGFLLANFGEQDMQSHVMENWLDPKGWVFWSGWGTEGTLDLVKQAGFEVITGEVARDAVEEQFLWIIARKGQ